jgi:hypothetical protein
MDTSKDSYERAKYWEVGGYSVPLSIHIYFFTFSTELSVVKPWLRYIQDLSNRVWVLQNQILTVVPRKERTVPGEWPRLIAGSPPY